jgi:hypothetical protein
MRGLLSFAHPNQPEEGMVLPHFEIEEIKEIKKLRDLAEVGYGAPANRPPNK